MVYKVFGIPIQEQMELDTLTYTMLLKDAFITTMRETEKGKQYLDECWILQQTQPNRSKLREQFK